jgi:quercetin dioxygenase-like cupin family protein
MHHLGSLADTPAVEADGTGHTRRVLFGRDAGSVHQEVAVDELAAGGRIDLHLHAFEQVLYVLEGSVALEVAGATEELAADDFVLVGRGVAHALRNESGAPARWVEASAPQPGGRLDDTVRVEGDAPASDADPAYVRGRFAVSDLPEPSKAIGLAGFGEANVGGAALRILLGPDTGATQLNFMVVQYAPGGFITEHDHAFEEGFLVVAGELEAVLDGETHTVRAGDYFWSGVGGMHALRNVSDEPARWLETQVPQPPSRYQARFVADWQRFLGR